MTNYENVYAVTSECLYPGDTDFDSVVIRLYGRTKDHEARTITVRGFEPYFLTRVEESDKAVPADHEDLIRYEEVDTDPLSERFDEDATDLVKVVTEYPHSVPVLRREFDKTWGADTIFTERFRIDHGVKTGVRVPTENRRGNHIIVDKGDVEPVEMKDVEPRVLTLDIETDDRDAGFPDPGEARILSIAAHDSYDDEYEVFLDLDGESFADFFDLSPVQKAKMSDGTLSLSDIGMDEPDSLNFEPSERQMLVAFGSWVQDKNPDLIAGWNSGDCSVGGFDLPHLIERMKSVGASPQRLSRESEVEVDDYNDEFKPNIAGRALYDLMNGWGDIKFTEPRSFKLDDVAADALDDAKIEHEDQGYFEMYEQDPVKFVNYNVRDVALTVGINEEEGVLKFKKRLKDIIGVDWRRTHENKEFIEMSVRRKCSEHDVSMITAHDNPHVGGDTDGVNYEGAYVFPSFSGQKENVVGIDLESLYPRTQQMLNVSPDARIERERAERENIPHVVAENGQTFRTDHSGIIRELIDDYMVLKQEFKEERNQAEPGTKRYKNLAEAYNVTKTVINSYYGFSGYHRSPIYNPHDAAAVTLTGQAVIKNTAEYIKGETEGSVAYGDSDSVYCKWPDFWGQIKTLETVKDHCEHLNNSLYPELCKKYGIDPNNNRWRMELEKLGSMFMCGSKKRYATLVRWSEGMKFNEVLVKGRQAMTIEEAESRNDVEIGHFSVTGYDCVKSNTAKISADVQEEVLEQIVRGADKGVVVETVHEAASSIDPADPDWDYIGVPQGLGKKIDPNKADQDDYYSWSSTGDHPRGEAPRAAWFANHLLDVEFSQGDKPLRAKVRPQQTVNGEEVDVIAFNSKHDLIDVDLTIDASEMQRKCLENPMEDILEAFGIETQAALRGQCQRQSGLEQFI